MSRDDRVRLAFAGLHPDQTRRLLAEGSAQRAVALVERGLVGSPVAQAAARMPAAARAQELARLGARVVLHGDPDYPEALAERPDAPDALFVEGRIPAMPGVAVVGTRRCTTYGRRVARSYGRELARRGWPLVSGLARGIDGAAHEGTVEVGGPGVAVLGCGIDIAYPREHSGLARGLVECGGAIVTEYPPGTPPEGWRFPPRNRIISGLAAAVVVVEAGTRGGALITASAALEQGTTVFAVPGDVDRESSRGCNLLIRDGAHPVLDPADLIEEIALILGEPPGPAQPGPGPNTELPDDLGAALDILRSEGTVDDFAVASRMDASSALAVIGRLEAHGAVIREGTRVIRT
jgi:DNA processing protein